MNAKDFIEEVYKKSGKDYHHQQMLNILMNHFLGEDWYTTCSIHNEQVNTEEILKRYPRNSIK